MQLPVRLLGLIGCLLGVAGLALPVQAADFTASAWLDAAGSRARLILPTGGTGVQHGAVEIQLEAGAKTYWRTPGETGVPTTAAFAGSNALAAPVMLFPAPVAFDDGAGGIAYGYIGRVVLPIRFAPPPSGAATVAVTVDYGVCLKNMCMPAQAKLSLGSGQGTPGSDLAALVADAVKTVPVATPLAAPGPVSITAAQIRRGSGPLTLLVTARATAEAPTLFAEGPDTLSSRLDGRNADGTSRFVVTFDGSTPTASPSGEILLTLVSGTDAIETKLDLDALAKQP